MNREEFLAELRSALEGKMSAAEIESQVDYYRAYIEGEIMKGRSEQEVLEELGPARLIAKTLTLNLSEDAAGGRSFNNEEENRGRAGDGGGYSGQPYDENDPSSRKGYKLRKVLSGVIIAVIVILILFLFGGLFRGILRIIIRFLPTIVIIALFMWLFRGGSRSGRG